ncbi:hypothetical protein HYH03_010217 [Edaphochlamys debaryana]|uniref:Protein kinase domain-containing protein n=1 Tax=Edaphochlamys debaryana TaxID=47281 RepID=A0A835XWE6_9CHLO|nr:hypothetical protein HYH03_010217 [Edaphochlamys debaryana]|eukprot:KAG2491431.1 hypothetical protein HYH03_010217 [Edaphochlamys debaryana]
MWLLSAALLMVASLWAVGSDAQLPDECAWRAESTAGVIGLHDCDINISSGGLALNASREPANWLSTDLLPRVQAPRLLLSNLTLRLPNCRALWALAADECTFRVSARWPSQGLQTGPGRLSYRRLVGVSSTALNTTLLCPQSDWAALIAAATPPLAPCGTALASTGAELAAALASLQLNHAAVLVTLTANITVPGQPSPQRMACGPNATIANAPTYLNDTETVVMPIYRNATVAGLASFNSKSPDAAGAAADFVPTELNMNLRRKVFGLRGWAAAAVAAGAPVSASRPVLALSDLMLVNSPPGPAGSWPAALPATLHSYLDVDRSGSAGPQMLALRTRAVLAPAELAWSGAWYARSVSLDVGVRDSATWFRDMAGPATVVMDADGNTSSLGRLYDYVYSYNGGLTAASLQTMPAQPDYDLWTDLPLLSPPSFAVAASAADLLSTLRAPWQGGPRAVLLLCNITLQADAWPQDGVPVSYPLILAGPSHGPPVWLNAAGMPLATLGSAPDSANTSKGNGGAGAASLRLLRLRLGPAPPAPLLQAAVAEVSAAAAADGGAWDESTGLQQWRSRCLTGQTSAATAPPLLSSVDKCVLELTQGEMAAVTSASLTHCARGSGASVGPSGPGCSLADSGGAGLPPGLRGLLLHLSNASGATNGSTGGNASLLSAPSPYAPYTPAVLNLTAVWLGGVALANSTALVVPTAASATADTPCDVAGLFAAATQLLQASAADPPAGAGSGDSSSSSNVGAIVGGVVGGCVGLALLALAAVWAVRRRRGGPAQAAADADAAKKAAAEAEAVETGGGGSGGSPGPSPDGACAAPPALPPPPPPIATATSAVALEATAAAATEVAAMPVPIPLASPAPVLVLGYGAGGTRGVEPGGVMAVPAASPRPALIASLPEADSGFSASFFGGQADVMADILLPGPPGRLPRPAGAAAAGAAEAGAGSHRSGGSAGEGSSGPAGGLHAAMAGQINEMMTTVKAAAIARVAAAGVGMSSGELEADPPSTQGRRGVKILGRGAYGVVYLGQWRGLPAAIKVMFFHAGDSSGRRERLAREVALTMQLDHAHIVPTYDFSIECLRGAHMPSLSEDSSPVYAALSGLSDADPLAAIQLRLVMQYCEGGTLRDALAAGLFHSPPAGLQGAASFEGSRRSSAEGTRPRPASASQQPSCPSPAPTAAAPLPSPSAAAASLLRTASASPALTPVAEEAAADATATAAAARPPTDSTTDPTRAASTPEVSPTEADPAAPASIGIAAKEPELASAASMPGLGFLTGGSLEPAGNMLLALVAARDMLQGLAYLHLRGVIHGDLTDNNVLVKAVQPVLTSQPATPTASRQLPTAAVGNGSGAGRYGNRPATASRGSPQCQEPLPLAPGGTTSMSADSSKSQVATASASVGTASGSTTCGLDVTTLQAVPALWGAAVKEMAAAAAGAGAVAAADGSAAGCRTPPASEAGGAASSCGGASTSCTTFNTLTTMTTATISTSALDNASLSVSGGPRTLVPVRSTAMALTVTAEAETVEVAAARQAQNAALVTSLLSRSFKIADFGLSAQLQGPSQTHLSNMVQGTPFFAAPEVVLSGHLSPASDVYSAGLVLWLLMHGTTLRAVRHLLPTAPYLPAAPNLLRATSPRLPPGAARLLRRCLAIEADRRPSATEALAGIETLLKEVAGPDLSRLLLGGVRREAMLGGTGGSAGH